MGAGIPAHKPAQGWIDNVIFGPLMKVHQTYCNGADSERPLGSTLSNTKAGMRTEISELAEVLSSLFQITFCTLDMKLNV